MELIGLVLAGLIGMTLGLLGAGGSAVAMFRGIVPAPGEQVAGILRPPRSRRSLALIAATGLGIGMLTGLVGVRRWLPRRAGPRASRAAADVTGDRDVARGHSDEHGFGRAWLHRPVELPWRFFTAVAVGGILVGSHIVRFVSQRALRRGFAVLLVLMSALILHQNRLILLAALDILTLTP